MIIYFVIFLILFGSTVMYYDYETNLRLDNLESENIRLHVEVSWFKEITNVIRNCENLFAL